MDETRRGPGHLTAQELIEWMEREGQAGHDLKLHAAELVRLAERWHGMEAWLSQLNPGLFPPKPSQQAPFLGDIMD